MKKFSEFSCVGPSSLSEVMGNPNTKIIFQGFEDVIFAEFSGIAEDGPAKSINKWRINKVNKKLKLENFQALQF